MNNNYGYIDDKPFKLLNKKEQQIIFWNESENKNNITITKLEVSTSEAFDIYNITPGKMTNSKEFYGIDSMSHPLTFLDSRTTNTNWRSIDSSTIESKMIIRGRESLDKIYHLTPKTKIRKFDYFNEKLLTYFSDNPLKITHDIDMKNLTVCAKKSKPQLLFTINYNKIKMKVFLVHSFILDKTLYNLSIKPHTYLSITFNKGIVLDDIIKISSRLDSTLHLCLLNRNRSYKYTLYDYSGRSYQFINYKSKKEDIRIPIFNICKTLENRNSIFENILSQFINVDFEKNNTLLPFINYYINEDFHELEFLQYYKVIEAIDYEKQQKKEKDKDKAFIIKYLKKYPKLKNYFFRNCNIEELSAEIRALRNYYSHEGFYLKDLPVPSDKPKRFKKVTIQWLYDVKRIVKIIAYLEMYERSGVYIDELELINHLF